VPCIDALWLLCCCRFVAAALLLPLCCCALVLRLLVVVMIGQHTAAQIDPRRCACSTTAASLPPSTLPPAAACHHCLQTRGILTWVNQAAPGAFHPEVRYVTVAGRLIQGAPLLGPGTWQQRVVGAGYQQVGWLVGLALGASGCTSH
jgi:hypothetical protein